ncbi:MAG: hypothetical protein ACYCOR_17845 [Acidobacteriaceae bacterium]
MNRLELALVNADKAGDTQAATVLAQAIRAGMKTGSLSGEGIHFKPDDGPLAGMSPAEQMFAGMGHGLLSPVHGAEEIAGTRTPAQVAQERQLAQPLLNTTPGATGNVMGNLMTSLPAAAIPGAETVPGAALTGMAYGALTPVGPSGSRATNIVAGGLAGGVTGAALNRLGPMAKEWMDQNAAKMASEQSQNLPRDATLKAAKAAGYRFPPATIHSRDIPATLESIGGKIITAQDASARNQKITNALARKALGLSEDHPLTLDNLAHERNLEGKAYTAVGDLPIDLKTNDAYQKAIGELGADYQPTASFPGLTRNDPIDNLKQALSVETARPQDAVAATRQLRFEGSHNIRNIAEPERVALGHAQRKAADAIDQLLQDNLESHPEHAQLLADYKKARVRIAKIHAVENALNDSTGNVSAHHLGAQLAKGVPLTGELKTIAQTAQAFPKSVQDLDKIGSRNVHTLMTGLLGIEALNDPKLGVPILAAQQLRQHMPGLLLSDVGQRLFTNPKSYDPAILPKAANAVLNNPTVGRLAPVLAARNTPQGRRRLRTKR